jgi:hypothetical protein
MPVLGGCRIFKRTNQVCIPQILIVGQEISRLYKKASMNMLVLVKYFLVSVFVILEA